MQAWFILLCFIGQTFMVCGLGSIVELAVSQLIECGWFNRYAVLWHSMNENFAYVLTERWNSHDIFAISVVFADDFRCERIPIGAVSGSEPDHLVAGRNGSFSAEYYLVCCGNWVHSCVMQCKFYVCCICVCFFFLLLDNAQNVWIRNGIERDGETIAGRQRKTAFVWKDFACRSLTPTGIWNGLKKSDPPWRLREKNIVIYGRLPCLLINYLLSWKICHAAST